MMAVDWSKPIEAVHEDGRVVSVEAQGSRYSGQFHDISPTLTGGHFSFRLDGAHPYPNAGWRIRNVAPQPAQPTYDPATHVVVKRMTLREAEDRYYGTGKDRIMVLRDLGVITPEPTPAERIAESTGHPLSVVQDVLAAADQDKAA